MIKQALKQPYDQRSIPICKRAQYLFDDAIHLREVQMAWSTPKLKEINCGMEINMYSPSEDEGREYEPDLF